MKTAGFGNQPVIDHISFRKEGFLSLFLEDGRILYIPLNRFPGIARLNTVQRRQYHIADGVVLMFEGDDEVYHIQEFLGTNTHQQSLYIQENRFSKWPKKQADIVNTLK